MGNLQSGGGTSAVAASAHAGCRRFRLTDPFLTRKTRKALAAHIGAPDVTAGIPEGRWMRAMTFERLVHDERFVSELLTKTVGQLGLPRPANVSRAICNGSVEATAKALVNADMKATFADTATMISSLGIPYVFLEGEAATAVLPDFAIVAPRREDGKVVGSWLVMGDAKDYERVRSRIDDERMLKGFLQVALGAESAAEWSALPTGMRVHRSGALAVPRNAFLQPEAVVEVLDDHRAEVRGRAEERLEEKSRLGDNRPAEAELEEYVAHLGATFNPATCVTCNMFGYCRSELRASDNQYDVLIEIGVSARYRPPAAAIVDGVLTTRGKIPAGVADQVSATVSGIAVRQKRRRTDPVGSPGAMYVVVAKSDSAALGIHGVAVRRAGSGWKRQVFLEPQSAAARRATMELIGYAIDAARIEDALPIHLVVPDAATADLLVSVADSVAGVELSRMRWQRDLDMQRPALTFDGSPATLAPPLTPQERLGVAFLLEADRSRSLLTRTPIVDLREVLASHVTPGGPTLNALRLDYLVRWAGASEPVDHREVSDEIERLRHTPGARLSNVESDSIHNAHRQRRHDPTEYQTLVNEALAYKEEVIDQADALLEPLPLSCLRGVFSTIEADSQIVWWRRVDLEALDLVRFGRTTEFWRNAQVALLEKDGICATQLQVMCDPARAYDAALDPGTEEIAVAKVVATDPFLLLHLDSRDLGDGDVAVALHVNGDPLLERDSTTRRIQGGSFKFGQLSIGQLTSHGDHDLHWAPSVSLQLEVGDELILADGQWFNSLLNNGHELTVVRPPVDEIAAPRATCTTTSYASDPQAHRWCCRPHRVAEGETADYFATERAAGKMNPEVWPPLIDEERFDVGDDLAANTGPDSVAPDELTRDDLD